MAERELLCVRVATLFRNKCASILRVIHRTVHAVRIVKVFFYFIVLDICLALTTVQAKKKKKV